MCLRMVVFAFPYCIKVSGDKIQYPASRVKSEFQRVRLEQSAEHDDKKECDNCGY